MTTGGSHPSGMMSNFTTETNFTLDEEYAPCVSPHSEDDLTYRIVYRIIIPIVCVVGIIGITLTVIVLTRKSMRSSTNCYLTGLSIADLLFLLILSTRLLGNLFPRHGVQYHIFIICMTYATIFLNTFLIASIWTTVMLAIERYIAICQPFIAGRACTVMRARLMIVVIYVCSFLCRLPNFWEHRVITLYDHVTNRSIVYMDSSAMHDNAAYRDVYPWIVDGLLSSILPFLLLLVLNVCLIVEVRKSSKYIKNNLLSTQDAHSSIKREELQITIMLISVVIVFFICQAPYVIYTAIVSINECIISDSFHTLRYMTMLLLTTKSAINFILYCWFSEKFCHTLKKLICVSVFMRRASKNGHLYYRRNSTTTRETTI